VITIDTSEATSTTPTYFGYFWLYIINLQKKAIHFGGSLNKSSDSNSEISGYINSQFENITEIFDALISIFNPLYRDSIITLYVHKLENSNSTPNSGNILYKVTMTKAQFIKIVRQIRREEKVKTQQ
jgi:hypothetical protein